MPSLEDLIKQLPCPLCEGQEVIPSTFQPPWEPGASYECFRTCPICLGTGQIQTEEEK